MKIFKYQLNAGQGQAVNMPAGAQVLSVQAQNGVITMWAMVDESAPMTTRFFIVYGTGWDIDLPPNKLSFYGTVQLGWTVWHVFEQLG